jgi:NitT/TauT family transport system ATP-binding protein
MPMPLLRLDKIQKSFTTSEGQKLLVLDQISFQLQENEVVALLGKSGSGKSTLLRIIAGLERPTEGTVFYRGRPLLSPAQGISMVFQNFALLPWLTVLENVELGLEAQGMKRKQRRQKALEAIDTIGLDGFESAYPKELSGGMRQRVGLARALVVEPNLLLMDEPFSALDILTAENLRHDLLELWTDKRTNTKSILFVTHDIEEAILMANRILIFASDPGRIQAEIANTIPFPRESQAADFRELLDKIYTLMTISERERLSKAKAIIKTTAITHPEYAYRLPDVRISELTGLLEAIELHEVHGKVDFPKLADELYLDVNSLFPLTDVLDMLNFTKIVANGNLMLLTAGKEFAAADILERKHLFAKHLLEYIPLARHIREVLDAKPNHRAAKSIFLNELEDFLSEEEADRLLRIIIEWGRYAEIFAYDDDTGILSLENPQ